MNEKSRPSTMLMTTACRRSASASCHRPAPRARATADEIPPPTASPDIIVISMTGGNTSAMPASSAVPGRATNHVSISPVEAWAIMIRTFGHAIPRSKGRTGASRRRWVRESIRCSATVATVSATTRFHRSEERRSVPEPIQARVCARTSSESSGSSIARARMTAPTIAAQLAMAT